LSAHEVAVAAKEVRKAKEGMGEEKETYERTRASEVKPAMATPRWSSIRISFFWYDASSPVERYEGRKG
jgi:hypothetical protein